MLCKLLDKVVAVGNELFDGSISELFVASKYVSDVAVVFVGFLSVDKVVSVARLDRHSDALFDELRLLRQSLPLSCTVTAVISLSSDM